jgi:anaerobic magnesium-protoporphyrin IX monomethyl ester cyclase
MRCTLIRPACRTSGYDEGTQECLGLGYVGSILRAKGHAVKVIDAELEKLSDPETVERAAESEPELIGLSLMSEDALDSTVALVNRLRDACPRSHITIGGNLPSFAPEWVLRMCKHLDSLIRFEGEKPLLELVNRLETGRNWTSIPGICLMVDGEVRSQAPMKPADDLDALPFPLRDTLPIAQAGGMMAPMATSRGCQGKCSFCAVHQFNLDPDKPWRFRSPTNVCDEIDEMAIDFGIKEVNFVDDDFIGNRKVGQPRARALAEEMIRRKLGVGFSLQCRAEWINYETFRPLKDAGLRMVFFGIEAVDRDTHKVFRKGQSRDLVLRTLRLLRDLDVYTHVGYIMFNPWTRLSDIREGVAFLRDIGHLNIHTVTNFLQLSPGTPLLEALIQNGTAVKEPHGGYRCKFVDAQTVSVKALFDRIIWPLFPRWYESLMAKWSVLSRRLQIEDMSSEQLLERMDDIVYEVAVRILDAVEADPGLDLFEFTRELKDYVRIRLDDFPELPVSPYRRQTLLCPSEFQ